MEKVKKIIGKKIRDLRIRLGLTQAQLGELIGADQSRVARWERGENIPGNDYRNTLKRVLKTDDSLFDPIDEPKPFFISHAVGAGKTLTSIVEMAEQLKQYLDEENRIQVDAKILTNKQARRKALIAVIELISDGEVDHIIRGLGTKHARLFTLELEKITVHDAG